MIMMPLKVHRMGRDCYQTYNNPVLSPLRYDGCLVWQEQLWFIALLCCFEIRFIMVFHYT